MIDAKMIELTPMEKKFELFLSFLSDINHYHNIKNVIANFPNVYRDLLNQIVIKTNIYKLIRGNNLKEFKRIEDLKREKIIKRKNKIKFEIKEITEEDIEKEILNEHKKIFKKKYSSNPLSLGQYTFNTMKLLYEPKSEIELISEIIKQKIKILILDCLNNIIIKNKISKKKDIKKYVFLNSNVPNKKIEKNLFLKKILRIKNPIDNVFFQNKSLSYKKKHWLEMKKLFPKDFYSMNLTNKLSSSRNNKLNNKRNIGINTIKFNVEKNLTLNSNNETEEKWILNRVNTERNYNNHYNSLTPLSSDYLYDSNSKAITEQKLQNRKSSSLNNKKKKLVINFNNLKTKIEKIKLKFEYNYSPLLKLRRSKLISPEHKNKKIKITLNPHKSLFD